MCILFIHINQNPQPNGYKLILASNRDEYFKRPAKAADFWNESGHVLGGQDMEKGREGGTWLAMSTKGRIGVILNILTPNLDPKAAGRGHLVADFVKSTAGDGISYLSGIANSKQTYNRFNLVTVETSPQIHVTYYTNATDDVPRIISDEWIALGNSVLGSPFEKINAGKLRFMNIVNEYGTCEKKDVLVENLVDFLKWEKKHFPDETMIKAAPQISKEKLEHYSSLFVTNMVTGYGTRTHTVILIDSQNKVEFLEWTMKEPITPEHPEWMLTNKTFQLEV